MGIASLFLDFVPKLGNIVDEYFHTDEEKAKAKERFQSLQHEYELRAQDYEKVLLEKRGDIIKWEARSTNVLTSGWRPITMLMFAFTVVAHAFGLTPDGFILPDQFWTLLEGGLIGYVGGRSVEKGIDKYCEMKKVVAGVGVK